MKAHTNTSLKAILLAASFLLLQACGTVKYTEDDGSPVDEALLSNIRLYGQGERTLRPAIARSSKLKDKDCSKQWELPFGVATSYELEKQDRIAWVRGLQVDERLSVVSATPDSGLFVGDKLVELDGYSKENTQKMLERLADLRESGDPFEVVTARGKKVLITPFEVCRGYAKLAPVTSPYTQEYHWLASVHPLEIFNPALTEDEALWMVLWTQGLSEEGGAKMKTFHYSKKTILTLIDIATLAMGVNGIVQAGQAAANQAIVSASNAATKAASEEIAKQAAEAIAKKAAEAAAKEYLQRAGEEIGRSIVKQTSMIAAESFASRMGMSLSMLSRVAATNFDDADTWAFERMIALGADPYAGASLHRKLLDQNLTRNAFIFDEERLTHLQEFTRPMRREADFMAAVRGEAQAATLITEMPGAERDETPKIEDDFAVAKNMTDIEMPGASDQ